MWRNWKDKLINFFFKEIEEDIENENEPYQTLYGTEKYRLPTLNEDHHNKVKYQYPKENMLLSDFR